MLSRKATEILNEKREVLNRLAKTLLEKETLEKEEFDLIVGQKAGAVA
ncbi:MAG: hypothetical protein WDN67_02480 [Candidatus Moraniibacteriota bacterium]